MELRFRGKVVVIMCYRFCFYTPMLHQKRFHDSTLPYWNRKIQYIFDAYKTLPFPFESVRIGCEGKPQLDIPRELSVEGFLKILRSWSSVATAKDQGIEFVCF